MPKIPKYFYYKFGRILCHLCYHYIFSATDAYSGPEIPTAECQHPQTSCPPSLLPLRNDRLPGKPAHPADIAAGPDGPAHGPRPGKLAAGRKASRARRARAAAGLRRWPGQESALSLKSRLPEYQPLQASGPPGLLPPRTDRLSDSPARPEGIAAGPNGSVHGRQGKPAKTQDIDSSSIEWLFLSNAWRPCLGNQRVLIC